MNLVHPLTKWNVLPISLIEEIKSFLPIDEWHFCNINKIWANSYGYCHILTIQKYEDIEDIIINVRKGSIKTVIFNTSMDKYGMKFIQNLVTLQPNIQKLIMPACIGINEYQCDIILQNISELTHLKNLKIKSCRISKSTFDILADKIINLEILELNNCRMESDTFSSLEKLTELVHFTLYHRFNVTIDKFIVNLKNLKYISLCLEDWQENYDWLCEMQELQHLVLWETLNMTDIFLKRIVKMKNLRHLEIIHCDRITRDELYNLVNSSLEYLTIRDCNKIKKTEIKYLKDMMPQIVIYNNAIN